VDLDLQGRSLGAQMKGANRSGARAVVVVGTEELAAGEWTVRDMKTSRQDRVADAKLEEHLDGLLGTAA
jgi:histidyl-tRNA synthetase